MSVLSYALRRLLVSVPVVLLVVTASFVLMSVVPGDPVRAVLGSTVSEEVVAARRGELGLERPLPEQFLAFLTGLSRGDLGLSAVTRRPVGEVLVAAAGPTAAILVMGVTLGVVGGVLAGVVSARFRGTPLDHVVRVLAVSGTALPPFWIGLLLEVVAVRTGWFPVGGYGTGDRALAGLVLPAVAMGLLFGSVLARTVRTQAVAALAQEHVLAAEARGVSARGVLVSHVVRSLWPAVLALVGVSLGGLVGVAVVLENVFVVPGLGQTLLDAVRTRDLPVVRGVCLLLAVTVVLANVAIDLARAALDPRVRG
ncbi:ABC transporter permease [Umezawaea sp. Da 62-37]|uniref:ABC transporter permease n=1 Tax=Umezawaea sp. Da 62-37 TaxID=3075927 RepID=UPI0028F71D63|nr:ABC transporter permease [Umezawaea sp. Da 62-37]WNV87948.1 ABC transporter permease [Umezawaea sp. Da 62-37]